MTADLDTRPRNGNTPNLPDDIETALTNTTSHAHADTAANAKPPRVESELVAELPTADELDGAIAHASDVVERQSNESLRAAMTNDEIQAEIAVAAQHRAAMLEVQRERNAADVKRARAALKVENEIANLDLRDELDARRARAQLNRMSDAVSYLAAQVRASKAARVLAAAPSVVAVLIGAVQSQDAWSRVFTVGTDNLVHWMLYGLEPLATLPLVAILLYEAASPSLSSTTSRSTWTARDDYFAVIKWGLLLASAVINVLPHLILREPEGFLWLWIPAAIVVSLSLLPALAAAFSERIVRAKTDAELTTPAGALSGELSKLARQVRVIEQRLAEGTMPGQLDEHGIPSANGIRKALAEAFGAAGMPDARNVQSHLRITRGVIE